MDLFKYKTVILYKNKMKEIWYWTIELGLQAEYISSSFYLFFESVSSLSHLSWPGGIVIQTGLNLQSFCLSLQNNGITDICHLANSFLYKNIK